MKILLTTYGTEGDTRPMVALARGLMQAGHEALLLGDQYGQPLAVEAGVPYGVLAGDIRKAIAELMAGGGNRNPGAATKSIAKLATGHTASWMKTVVECAEGCEALVFAGLTSYVALSAAEHLKLPVVGAGLQPVVPTRAFPNPFLPPLPLPGFCNAASHRLVMALLWRAFRGSINEARKSVTRQAVRTKMWSGYPVLLGISEQLLPRPADWPAHVAMQGDWPLASRAWTPPAQLQAFLEAGEAPVYVGFGSMVGFDRTRTVRMVAEALQGRRALLSGGWNELDKEAVPSNILPIGPAPHDLLFPLCSVVVHHGGAGTSHTAARAGEPAVVTPFAGDQFFWARQLARVGVAAEPLSHRELSAATLAQRIDTASGEPMRRRAAEVGARMRSEQGVRAAVVRIEEFLRRGLGRVS